MTRGFEAVAEEFDPGLGAAFAATVDGELVVDLWGGPGWQEDTLCLVFSGTKGFVAACLLLLVERGELELDAPLVRYWPEFSSRRVLVRHVVSHTTGLPGMRPPPTMEELLYSALEDYKLDIMIGQGPAARTHTIDVKPFTFVGATTRAGLLSSPLRSRFGIVLRLQFYGHEDLRIIVERSAEILGVEINREGALEIASRSRGSRKPASSA